MAPDPRPSTADGFARGYWRGAHAVGGELPELSPDTLDDATFRLLADNLPTLCWVANGDGSIVWYNRRWHDYCGTTPAEMEGWGWTEVHDPGLLPAVLERWRAAIARGEPFEMVFPLRGADGVFRPFLTRIAPVRDSTGAVKRWCGVNTKISDQVAAESALRTAEERLRLASRATNDAIWDWHFATNQVLWNEALQTAYGHAPDAVEPTGEWWIEHIHPDDRERVSDSIHAAIDGTAESWTDEYRFRRADGTYADVLDRGHISRDASGRAVRMIGAMLDLSARKAAEAERDRAAALLSAFAEAVPGVVYAKDRAGRFLVANRGTAELIGKPPELFLGRTDREVLDDEAEAETLMATDRRIMESGAAEQAEEAVRLPDGTPAVWLSTKAPFRNDKGEVIGLIGSSVDVTRRIETENRLRASESRLRFLSELDETLRASGDAPAAMYAAAGLLARHLETSRCAYAAVDADNDAFTIHRDYTAPGVSSSAGTYSLDLFGPRAAAEMRGGRTLVVRDVGGELLPGEGREMFHAIGIEAIVCCPLVKEGRLVAMMAVHQDRPRPWRDDEVGLVEAVVERCWAHVERVGAEARLRDSEKRYRTLFESIESGFCVAEVRFDALGGLADYCVVEANPAFYRQTGFPEAIMGQWLREAAPGLEEHWFETYGRIARTGEPERFEQGSVALGRWFDVFAFAVGEPGESRVAILFNDISARRNAEERLRELNETLESQVAARSAERDRLWNLSQDMLARADYSGMMSAVSPAWTEVLGWSETELLSRGYATFMHPDDMPPTLEAIGRMAETRRPTRFENRIATRDGGFKHIEWTVAPEPDGVNFIAVGRDLSHAKAREAELARTQDALRQAQKMEAVGQLTGGIAHDFNNMLAVVIGSLDLLGRRVAAAGDPRAKRYLDAASDGAKRAATLTQRLLAFSRQQPLRPEPVEVNKLVVGMSDLLRHSLGGAVRLETVLAGGLWRTHADPNQLESVILNLAVNARDAMPEGGRLTIETQNAHLDERYVAAHLGVSAGQYVLIAVTDTGAGMPPDVLAKAFDPFFTTKAVGKGTGLGLSQVYGFVKQSGGHVKIYSEPEQGTTVKVYLPRLLGAGGEAAAAADSADLPLGEREEVVLVVEDEPAVRRFSVDALAELGYRVLEADGAASALRLLDAHPEIALMFTDVVMPDVNGRKLADEALRRRPDLKVLFTTGYTRNAVVHNGVLDPGVELIGKPFTIEQLAAKLRAVLDAPAAAGSARSDSGTP